jgi:hypothetical protein
LAAASFVLGLLLGVVNGLLTFESIGVIQLAVLGFTLLVPSLVLGAGLAFTGARAWLAVGCGAVFVSGRALTEVTLRAHLNPDFPMRAGDMAIAAIALLGQAVLVGSLPALAGFAAVRSQVRFEVGDGTRCWKC